MFSLIRSPAEALSKAGRTQSFAHTLLVLIVSSILFAIGGYLITSVVLPTNIAFAYFAAAGLFFMTIIIAIILSIVVMLIANTMGGRGHFYHSITSVSYSLFPGSIGFLVLALSINVPFGLFIGIAVSAIFVSLGLAIFFKSLKEFFNLDSASALALFIIAIIAFAVSFFASTTFLSIVNVLLQL